MQEPKLKNNITFKTYRGESISQVMDPLAQLRMSVFREYPYLYDRNIVDEKKYLSRYINIKDSFVLMVFENGQAIGATTATPLVEELEDFRTPYENAGIDSAKTFYFGEAMLHPAYRGMGIYKTFMHERTKAAIAYDATMCTFMAVNRPDNHPLKPRDYQDLKPIWRHYGFIEHSEIQPQFSWKDVNQEKETQKPFTAWLKII